MTGTGPGIGMFWKPQVVLRPGDDMRVYIQSIGTLVNEDYMSNGEKRIEIQQQRNVYRSQFVLKILEGCRNPSQTTGWFLTQRDFSVEGYKGVF